MKETSKQSDMYDRYTHQKTQGELLIEDALLKLGRLPMIYGNQLRFDFESAEEGYTA